MSQGQITMRRTENTNPRLPRSLERTKPVPCPPMLVTTTPARATSSLPSHRFHSAGHSSIGHSCTSISFRFRFQLQFLFLSDPTMYHLTAPGGAVVLVARCARRVPSLHARWRPRTSDSISISISLPRNILLPPMKQLYTTSTPTLRVTTLVLVLQHQSRSVRRIDLSYIRSPMRKDLYHSRAGARRQLGPI